MDHAALYREYHKTIYYTCLRIIGSPMDAEECMHNAFIKLFTTSKMQYINKKACYGWLKKVAVREAIDRLRSLDFRMNTDSLSIDSHRAANVETSYRETDREEKNGRLEAAVSLIKELIFSFPSGYRTVLSLHLFEGYDFDEIAEITKRKPASVRSAYSRGRKKLQQELRKHGCFKDLYSE